MAEEIQPKTKKYLGYGAAVVVALLVYVWWKNRQASSASTLATTTMPSGAMGATTDVGSTLPAASPIGTFSDWANAVQSWATSSLGADAANVQNALQAYSNLECLTPSQYSIIDQGLAQFGAPPNAPYTGLVMCPQSAGTPTPTPTPSPTPTVQQTVGGINPTSFYELAKSAASTLINTTGEVYQSGALAIQNGCTTCDPNAYYKVDKTSALNILNSPQYGTGNVKLYQSGATAIAYNQANGPQPAATTG